MNEEDIEETSKSKEVTRSESIMPSETSKESLESSNVDSLEATSESASKSTSESLSATTSMTRIRDDKPTQLAKIDNNMEYCPYCGEHLQEGTKFCPNCGANLTNGKKRNDPIFAKDLKKIFTDHIYPKFSNHSQKTRKKIIIITGITVCLIFSFLIYGRIKNNTIELKDAYHDYCDPAYATLSHDGTSLMIDTNPYDLDDDSSVYDEDASNAILKVNDALGFPDSVATRMNETRSVDGTQSYEDKNYLVTWHYHPDQGLEVVYSEK